MKLAPRDAPRYFARPEPDRTGLLIFGGDAMRVALRRQEVIAALLGPRGEEEMRLTRIQGGDLRGDPAALSDAIRAQGFFPGARVVFVEDATDAHAPAISAAMEGWQPGDAQLLVTARQLAPKSALRALFEKHPNAYAAGIYDDPPSRAEIEATLEKAGLARIDRPAMDDLLALAQVLDPGDFRQTVEKLALYKLGDDTPVASADVSACAPGTTEAALDDLIHVVAEGRGGEVGPLLSRLAAQGVQPVGLCIAANRHFRALHAAASDPGGPASGMSRLRPPVHFKSRDRMVRQAQAWGMRRLEQALSLLVETDLTLRSSQRGPAMAVMERSLIRLAVLARR
ncbi:DNA polymerase III delta subunit [Rhodovulum imhoffii]|uniref:DNA-directed DNA polymerase n=1 Tax=Rhodovulum imhoffii TaxID=365340 RepID=A0A2T5BUV7_9RHOB|nr:DNA polymerase III subunit delta [Rhodovulum imhoffii]MBK5934912.1 DNA polymerase III subunit delta [Rhodovulum imhoffii]PTN03313.1 DNA polymerase III delta subunit [Rhodovulum imhoffii]